LTIAAALPTGAGEIAASAAVARPKASAADTISVLIMISVPSCVQAKPGPAPQHSEIGAARREFRPGKAKTIPPKSADPGGMLPSVRLSWQAGTNAAGRRHVPPEHPAAVILRRKRRNCSSASHLRCGIVDSNRDRRRQGPPPAE
jgi:hypothetical protein